MRVDRMTRRGWVALAALVITAAHAAPPPARGKRRDREMVSSDQVFLLVRDVAVSRPVKADTVAAATRVPLKENAEQSNKYFRIYEGAAPPDSVLSRVEARVPAAGAGEGKDGMVILDLRESVSCVGRSEVLARYGKNAVFEPAPPNAPPEAPEYLVYKIERRSISFGFSRQGQKCLTSVVLDSIGA